MGGESDVPARFQQGIEQESEGLVFQSRPESRDGEQGGELGVVGELDAGVFQGGYGLGVTIESKQANGATCQGVGLLGGGGDSEGEGAFIGGQGLGMGALRREGEGLLGGDFGHVGVAGVELAQCGEHVIGFAAVAGTDNGVEGGFPV